MKQLQRELASLNEKYTKRVAEATTEKVRSANLQKLADAQARQLKQFIRGMSSHSGDGEALATDAIAEWDSDSPSARLLEDHVRHAHDALRTLLNPKASILNLNGLNKAQTAANTARVAEQALTCELLTLLRHEREQASESVKEMRRAHVAWERSAREQQHSHERERAALVAKADKDAAILRSQLNEALARLHYVETTQKEDFDYQIEGLQRDHKQAIAGQERRHEEVLAALNRQLTEEREEAALARERLERLQSERLDAARADAAVTLQILRVELRLLEAWVGRLVHDCAVLTRQRSEGQLAVSSLRTELRMATATLAAEVERLHKLICDALASDAPTSAWRALQVEALKPHEPPYAFIPGVESLRYAYAISS